MTAPDDTGPNIRLPPPLVYLAGFVVGWLGSRWVPTHIVAPDVARAVGAIPVLAGGLLVGAAIANFQRAGTTVRPDRASRALVIAGPYRITRNPIYVGLALLYIGLAIAAQSLWALLILPLVLWVIRTRVIAREEAFLHARFGATYADYQARVRRWL
jgi:protein-S-isoprenylcysteine O-methyltransferase Ste14